MLWQDLKSSYKIKLNIRDGETIKIFNNKMFCLLGLQHLFAAFSATLLVPIIVGIDPSIALFSQGIGTLIFHLCTKNKVPVFLGSSFAFIPPVLQVVNQYGDYSYAQGGIIVAGQIYILVQFIVYKIGVKKVTKLIPQEIVAPIILIIGIQLQSTAVSMLKTNIVIGLITTAIIVFLMLFTKGIISILSVLIGIISGSIIYFIIYGYQTYNGGFFSIPAFSAPKFSINAIVLIAPVVLATLLEHIGDISANQEVTGKDFMNDPGLHRTLIGDGLATMFAGLIGSVANTTYSENTGVLAITKIYNPNILNIAAILAIIFSFISPITNFFNNIPDQVIGGSSLILFGMISAVGLRTMVDNKIDYSQPKNLIITQIMLVFALGGMSIKIFTVELSGVALQAITGIVLNLILPNQRGA